MSAWIQLLPTIINVVPKLVTRPKKEEIKPLEKPFDPNATMIDNTINSVVTHAQGREFSPKRAAISGLIAILGYFAVDMGYITDTQLENILDVAEEVEIKK